MTLGKIKSKSSRLKTTTPTAPIGHVLSSFKPQITLPTLFTGYDIQKVSSKGTLVPRLLTLSEDLFTLFVSHHKVGNAESVTDRVRYKGFKAYAKVVETVTGAPVQANHDIRVIDVADILFVQSGFIGSRKLEVAAYNCSKDAAEHHHEHGTKKKKKISKLDPTKVISIFHNNGKTMDFLVESEEDRMAIVDAIRIIREAYNGIKMTAGREERLLRYAWYDTDYDKSGLMEQSEFLQLLGRINIYVKQERAIRIFKTFLASKLPRNGGRIGGPRATGITFEECLHVLRKINHELNDGKECADVLFDHLFGEEKWIVTADEFLTKFLRNKQHEKNSTIDDVHKRFGELNSMVLSGGTQRVGEDGKADRTAIDRTAWREHLMSRQNDVFDPEKQRLDESSLNRPLTEYWINSSHNTYLTGDQVKSLSSVEMYVLAMHRGCKCLELDCWDDDDEGEPIVKHGWTITSKITFQSIITCVKGYVDAHPDTLPIILSLENHCTHHFQEIMADTLNDTLGDQLYKFPKSSGGPLPSPLDLVGKVVVKGKRPMEQDDETTTGSESSMEDQMEGLALGDEELIGMSSFESEGSEKSSSRKRDKAKEKFYRQKGKREHAKVKDEEAPPMPKIVPQLAALTLFNGVKFKDFTSSMDIPTTDMHSISESAMGKLYKDPENVQKWKEYNVEHMSRIYPAGGRIDSSNYDPVMPWSSGCQLVALNFQTDDSPMTINDGRFLENGGCGYVHRSPSTFPSNNEPSAVKILRIKVLSGSCLPKPYGESAGEVIDPYVVMRVYDVEKSKKMRSTVTTQSTPTEYGHNDMLEVTDHKTSSVRDNGFCPQWDDEEYFSFTVNSQVAMVEITVADSNRGFIDEIMCKTAVPVSCLRQGLRSVQFYDQCSSQHGPFGMARILLDVDINYVM